VSDAVTAWFEAVASTYDRGWTARATKAWEARAVMKLVGPTSGRVLELGCGAGAYTRRLLAAGASEVVAVDRAAAMAALAAGPGVRTVVADATKLALGERFPIILCAGMLEFVDDVGAVMATMERHLAPGGRAVVFVPRRCLAGHLYRAWHLRHGLAGRLFDLDALASAGREAGLAIHTARDVLPFGLVARLGRV
jgi:ubiquinone/menaquinone biosynthesis C-methylase UbiE